MVEELVELGQLEEFINQFSNKKTSVHVLACVVAQTLPCPRSNLGYPKSEFRFGTSQTGISILDDLSQI